MEVIIMTNGQMGVSGFGRSGSFSSNYGWEQCSWCRNLNSWQPYLGLNMKSGKRMRVCGLQIKVSAERESGKPSIVGGILEKEFQFEPTFDDYLKAMESVKVGREKKQAQNSKEYGLNHDSRGSDSKSSVRDERSLKTRRPENQEKRSRRLENYKFEENGYGATGNEDVVIHEIDYKGGADLKLNDELSGKQSSVDANLNGNFGGMKTDVRLSNCRARTVNPQNKKFNIADKLRKTQNARESPVVYDNVKSRASIPSMTEKFAYDKSFIKMLRTQGMISEGEEVDSRTNEVKNGAFMDYAQVDKSMDRGFKQKNELIIKSHEDFLQNIDGQHMDVERAAFKSFEGLNDVKNKPHTSRREMEERVQKLAKCLNGADIDMPEWMFSKMMRSARIKFTDHTILRIIQILGKLGNWRRVLQVIEWLQMRERYKSYRLRHVYTTALYVLGKAGRPVEALNIFHEMQQQMSSYPDLVAYHSIAVTLGQAGHMKELFDVIDTMRSPPKKKFKRGALEKWDPRLEPDIVVYNAVLNACVKRKQWEGAFWVLQQLKQQGLPPSTATYGLVMEVMFACGKYNLVHEFFKKLQKSSIPNALAYKILVNTLWSEGKTDEAVLAVKDMERRGIVGSAGLYYDLARCLCSAGRCEEALAQVEKICKVANKPLVVTYTGLIQACLDFGNIQNAEYIFSQMMQFCYPNLVTFNIMLKAYLEHGFFEEAKELFWKMSEDGNHIRSRSDYKVRVLPDIYTFNIMLDGCIAEKKWDDFEYVYGTMLKHGFHFNANRHLRMVLDACRARKGEPLEITWNHLGQADRIPPPPLVKERFCMMLEKDDHDSALACITSKPIEELQAFSKRAWLNLLKENATRFRRSTLIQLIQELKVLVHSSNSTYPVLQNMLISCNDFLRTHMTGPDPETHLPETVCTTGSEITLSSS